MQLDGRPHVPNSDVGHLCLLCQGGLLLVVHDVAEAAINHDLGFAILKSTPQARIRFVFQCKALCLLPHEEGGTLLGGHGLQNLPLGLLPPLQLRPLPLLFMLTRFFPVLLSILLLAQPAALGTPRRRRGCSIKAIRATRHGCNACSCGARLLRSLLQIGSRGGGRGGGRGGIILNGSGHAAESRAKCPEQRCETPLHAM
mmetsp:Transcript_72504/g.183547  ORF Transcript_72504/g.183547 Transcript_72504/m.183547 type:complete len:200 (-) Transcript_72504:23-622(-)